MYYLRILSILLIVILALTNEVFSQHRIPIIILDVETNLAIPDVSYTYGNQQGVSDNDGVIYLIHHNQKVLELSHVRYGESRFEGEELSNLLKDGVIYIEPLVFSLYPITVIAVKDINTPSDEVTVQFQDKLAHDGAAILTQSPAINSIKKSGNYGFDPVFRGFKYDQLNIVFDGGQSATAACPNRMDPPTSQMAPNMLERIEILKGPHALRFGTGFGATINFIPTELNFSNTIQPYGRISSSYESNGQIPRTETQFGVTGQNYDLSLLGSWSQGGSYKAGNGNEIAADFNRGSYGFNGGFKVFSNQEVRLSAVYNVARDTDFPALAMDLRDDDTWLFNASHKLFVNDRNLTLIHTSIFGSFVDHTMNNLMKDLNPRMVNAETNAETHNYGIRSEAEWSSRDSRIFAGFDVKVEGAQGTRSREFLIGPNAGNIVFDNAWQESEISKTSLFGEFHQNFENFHFIVSSRLELNKANTESTDLAFANLYDDLEPLQFNPSISLGVNRYFKDNLKIGFWYGRAQRSGSLTERYINYFPVGIDPYEMVGNPDLNPEVNHQVDFSISKSNASNSISIDLFAAYLRDLISSEIDPTLTARIPSSPGVRRFINIDEALKLGFEIGMKQQISKYFAHDLNLAYTYGEDLVLNEPLPEIAPLDVRYRMTSSLLDQKLKPEVSVRYVMDQSRVSEQFGETESPSFTLVDIGIGYQLSEMITANFDINNLLDENYYEHLSRSVRGSTNPIFAPGRNFVFFIHF